MESARLSFRLPPAREEELIAELWQLGTRGVEQREELGLARLEAWFDPRSKPSAGALRELCARCDAELVESRSVPSEDWLAAYRARSTPVAIGPLVVDPREPEADGAGPGTGGPEVLRIPARNAFGTGSHESTRLILQQLCDLELDGLSVLDIGCGSGILALAALRRGARRATGFDIDVGSVVTATDNARLNRLRPALFAGTVDAVRGSFDLVLINILPHRWLDRASAVAAYVRPGGRLLVSGLLASEAAAVEARLADAAMARTETRVDGEWAALGLVAG